MSQATDERSTEHEQIPTERREIVLDRDGHRCQLCNAAGRSAGGGAVLQVHHKQYDPEAWDVNDPENLISLCLACHNWAHKRPSTSEVPVELSDEAETMLLEHDYEILQLLGAHGPLSTSELVDALTADMTSPAVRERLWLLMGLDVVCESQDVRVLDQDAKTDEWGLPTDITSSERGRIPEDQQTLIQRVEDERVRRALDRGCSREEVASVLDLHTRTTRHKERRARAYGFPLDAFTSHGRPAADTSDEDLEADAERNTQQRLETMSTASESSVQKEDSVTQGAKDSKNGSATVESEPATVSSEASGESVKAGDESDTTDEAAVEVTSGGVKFGDSKNGATTKEIDEFPPHIQPLIKALAAMRNQREGE